MSSDLLSISNAPDPLGEGWDKIGASFRALGSLLCPGGRTASTCSALLAMAAPGTKLGGAASVGNRSIKVGLPLGSRSKPEPCLAPLPWGANVLDIFGIGADGAVWHKAWRGGADWDPPGTSWASLGGDFSKALGIAAVSWGKQLSPKVAAFGHPRATRH